MKGGKGRGKGKIRGGKVTSIYKAQGNQKRGAGRNEAGGKRGGKEGNKIRGSKRRMEVGERKPKKEGGQNIELERKRKETWKAMNGKRKGIE